jgi:hypothetical protein
MHTIRGQLRGEPRPTSAGRAVRWRRVLALVAVPLHLALPALPWVAAAGLLATTARAAASDEAAEQVPAEVQAALEGLASEDREVRQAAAEAACTLSHPALLPALTKALKDEYRTVREPVIRALGARQPQDERRKASRLLETRLKELDKRPETKEELLAVVQALHDLAQASALDALLEGIETTSEQDVAEARLHAVGNVPHKEAVERLLAYAARGRRGESHRGAALKALEYATNVKLGSLDAWQRWWADHKRTFDPEVAAGVRAQARAAAQAKQQERDERRAKREEGRGKGEAPPKEAPPDVPPDAPKAPAPPPKEQPDAGAADAP